MNARCALLHLLLFLATLQDVPRELEEAAAIDGATRPQTILRVIIPLLWGLIVPQVAFGLPGSILILRNFFANVPKELEEPLHWMASRPSVSSGASCCPWSGQRLPRWLCSPWSGAGTHSSCRCSC
jgi:hypothetical protein